MTPDEIIGLLDLRPHPEGGHYAETWRGEPGVNGRPVGTAIYYLLRAGERSHWHRVDATEIWVFHAGGPLALDVIPSGAEIADRPDGPVERGVLGPDLTSGERPQRIVPAHAWQCASPLGAWTLVTCAATPGFSFDGFELAQR